jgi:hypothetical protein
MRDDQYVLNHCTPYLARRDQTPRHDFGYGHFQLGDVGARVREAWRFPIIDSCAVAPGGGSVFDFNDVTFVYPDFEMTHGSVSVVGTFDRLYKPINLNRINFLGESTAYFAVTIPVRKRSVFHYRFLVDGEFVVDQINPQRDRLDNGEVWSRFFTWECTSPVVLQRWQLGILERFCDHILPFRTKQGERFFYWYYKHLADEAKAGVIRGSFRIDDSAGAANYIDKILAKEERHHLGDYNICLKQLGRIIRDRDPDFEPENASEKTYFDLYNEMATGPIGEVVGWNLSEYGSPRHFLNLLRRHAFTGAFSHPKYGGNLTTAGWQFLKSRFPFEWHQSLEQPMGTSTNYRG